MGVKPALDSLAMTPIEAYQYGVEVKGSWSLLPVPVSYNGVGYKRMRADRQRVIAQDRGQVCS